MVYITSEVEINRSPASVRDVLLNFPDWPEWLTTGLAVTPKDKGKRGSELGPGDRLRSDFRGTVVKPKILENTPATFRWRGRFGGILIVGHRRFYFNRSEKNPGGTTLVQEEDIDGLLAFMFKKNSGQGKVARDAMEKFNLEIKARAESL